jgi:hypothetical protein
LIDRVDKRGGLNFQDKVFQKWLTIVNLP